VGVGLVALGEGKTKALVRVARACMNTEMCVQAVQALFQGQKSRVPVAGDTFC
jgi:hypothetical protein